jgi:endo-1,4-beta-xylanase
VPECLPEDVAEQAAARWASPFRPFAAHSDAVRPVTLWGVADGYSWLNDWPIDGRTDYALRVIDAASAE